MTIFFSPERLWGEEYTYSCDIWSLGLCLMYAGMGKFPYGDVAKQGQLAMMETIVNSDVPQFPDDSNFSMEFKSFVTACLEKNPSQRWTAEDLGTHPFLAEYE